MIPDVHFRRQRSFSSWRQPLIGAGPEWARKEKWRGRDLLWKIVLVGAALGITMGRYNFQKNALDF